MSNLDDREIEALIRGMPKRATTFNIVKRVLQYVAGADYERGKTDGIKSEQKRIIKMLNRATDTRDLDRRLKELENE